MAFLLGAAVSAVAISSFYNCAGEFFNWNPDKIENTHQTSSDNAEESSNSLVDQTLSVIKILIDNIPGTKVVVSTNGSDQSEQKLTTDHQTNSSDFPKAISRDCHSSDSSYLEIKSFDSQSEVKISKPLRINFPYSSGNVNFPGLSIATQTDTENVNSDVPLIKYDFNRRKPEFIKRNSDVGNKVEENLSIHSIYPDVKVITYGNISAINKEISQINEAMMNNINNYYFNGDQLVNGSSLMESSDYLNLPEDKKDKLINKKQEKKVNMILNNEELLKSKSLITSANGESTPLGHSTLIGRTNLSDQQVQGLLNNNSGQSATARSTCINSKRKVHFETDKLSKIQNTDHHHQLITNSSSPLETLYNSLKISSGKNTIFNDSLNLAPTFRSKLPKGSDLLLNSKEIEELRDLHVNFTTENFMLSQTKLENDSIELKTKKRKTKRKLFKNIFKFFHIRKHL